MSTDGGGNGQKLDLPEFIERHMRTNKYHNERVCKYTVSELKALCNLAIETFKKEPTLVTINPPLVIVSDVHGQYFDLLRVMAAFNQKNKSGILRYRWVFLGDYVDRGRRSLECVCLVLALKCHFPKFYQMLRGNHETAMINKVYGFHDEIMDRFKNDAQEIWELFNKVFEWMPLACTIGGKVLCMHGGISPHLQSLDDIRKIERPLNDLETVPLALDLLWSDPVAGNKGFTPNVVRGVSVQFGEEQVAECCDKLGIQLIVRGHQVMMTGFGHFANQKMITVFTATRYQTDQNNNGAVLWMNKAGKIGIKVFRPDPADTDDRSAVISDKQIARASVKPTPSSAESKKSEVSKPTTRSAKPAQPVPE